MTHQLLMLAWLLLSVVHLETPAQEIFLPAQLNGQDAIGSADGSSNLPALHLLHHDKGLDDDDDAPLSRNTHNTVRRRALGRGNNALTAAPRYAAFSLLLFLAPKNGPPETRY